MACNIGINIVVSKQTRTTCSRALDNRTWKNVMFDHDKNDFDDLDYEDMDDLPLLDHIEWNHYTATAENEAHQDPSQINWLDD